MAYVKNTWVDQDVERPKTYQVTTNQDGSITLTDDFGIVTELGTPVNATNMNHIEDGIYTNDTHIGDLTQLSTTVKTDLVSAINEANGGSSRNIGEIITSTVPLSDAGLHLLDGTKLPSGTYSDFVAYMANAYNSTKTYNSDAFTVVGSPTITDGVASDFSGSDYIYSNISITSNNTFKISVTFTTSSTRSSSNKRILKLAPNNRLMICDADYLRVWLGEGSSWNVKEGWQITTSQLAGDTEYKVDVEYTGTEYKVYLDDELMQTYSSNTNILQSITDIYLGYDTSSTSNYFTGSIDLKELQIGVDGDIVFSGSKANGFCLEDEWQTSVTSYGVCGKYVYNEFDNSVRLPKITGFIEGGTVSTLGDLTEAGLPDHLHTLTTSGRHGETGVSASATWCYDTGYTDTTSSKDTNNASVSNSIYGNSNTVQPQSVKVLYYVVIGTTTKTSIEVDIDDIATDLNGKADTDLSNVNDVATSKIAGWAMPSTTYDTLTLGASGASYIAPSNGWFYLSKSSGGAGKSITINSGNLACQNISYNSSNNVVATLPVRKGDSVTITYDTTGTVNVFRFVYAKGSESEA